MSNDYKIQWHSGFAAAIDLELAEYRDFLTYEREYNLNRKPLEIDLLVVKKEKNIRITNEIGSFFLGHNILEYKSPYDELNIDTFYKSQSYAGLYKSYGKTVNERKASDITVTIVRESKPYKLFMYFMQHGIQMEKPYPGIYHIRNVVPFQTQILVTKELDPVNHTWLKALSARMKREELEYLLHRIEALKTGFDKELADAILEITVQANKQIIDELKGDDHMCHALMEIMEPEIAKIKESVAQSVTQSVTESVTESVTQSKIASAVKSFHDFGISDSKIKETLIRNFELSAEEAEEYL